MSLPGNSWIEKIDINSCNKDNYKDYFTLKNKAASLVNGHGLRGAALFRSYQMFRSYQTKKRETHMKLNSCQQDYCDILPLLRGRNVLL